MTQTTGRHRHHHAHHRRLEQNKLNSAPCLRTRPPLNPTPPRYVPVSTVDLRGPWGHSQYRRPPSLLVPLRQAIQSQSSVPRPRPNYASRRTHAHAHAVRLPLVAFGGAARWDGQVVCHDWALSSHLKGYSTRVFPLHLFRILSPLLFLSTRCHVLSATIGTRR